MKVFKELTTAIYLKHDYVSRILARTGSVVLMQIAHSRNGVPIRLTDERWKHIRSGHPEMQCHRDQVLETIENPDFIQEGDFGALLAVPLYPCTALTTKYVIAPYREIRKTDGFVLTAYLSSRPSSRRRVLWKRCQY